MQLEILKQRLNIIADQYLNQHTSDETGRNRDAAQLIKRVVPHVRDKTILLLTAKLVMESIADWHETFKTTINFVPSFLGKTVIGSSFKKDLQTLITEVEATLNGKLKDKLALYRQLFENDFKEQSSLHYTIAEIEDRTDHYLMKFIDDAAKVQTKQIFKSCVTTFEMDRI